MIPMKMNNTYVLNKMKINGTESVQSKQVPKQPINGQTSFQDVLNKVKDSGEVKFSKHATSRLETRNIQLTEAEMNRINEGIGKAKTKGVREALIMMDNKAFIASVQKNTIITAVTDEQLKDNVFTNIDGAVIV